jgi:hypothetical protein
VLSALFCLFAIYLVSHWQAWHSSLTAQGVEAMDREAYLRGSLQVGLPVVGGAVALSAAVLLLGFGLTKGLEQIFRYIPWPVVVLGLVGVSVMAIAAFQSLFHKPSAMEHDM